jgi:hypothetical protein
VALTITRSSSRRVVFRAANVNTAQGVQVAGLATGVYAAQWVLTDANRDTRTIHTRFVEQGGARASAAAAALAASAEASRAAASIGG